jgi:undecaprenyl diphosphate synthase
MGLFMTYLQKEVDNMNTNGVRLKVVGDKSRFAPVLQELIVRAEAQTASNTRITLTVCANYGGRWDILLAMRALLKARPDLAAQPDALAEADLTPYLAMHFAPEPDLFIRTGGEQRISNFLLWQLAYTELYFTDAFWPDFGAAELDRAFESFRQRERRFGRTGAQLGSASPDAAGPQIS